MSRALLHPDLRAAHLPTDARVILRWNGEDVRGITDTLGSIHLLVTAAVHTVTDGGVTVTYHPDRPALPVFRDARCAEQYLRQRAVDPSEAGRVCRSALRFLAARDTGAERVSATPVGATIAMVDVEHVEPPRRSKRQQRRAAAAYEADLLCLF